MLKSPYPGMPEEEDERREDGEINYTPGVPHLQGGGVMLPGVPGAEQDEFGKFLQGVTAQKSKFGTVEYDAMEQGLAGQRRSLPAVAGKAMTGFADALMQGVAGQGDAGFSETFDRDQAARETAARNTFSNKRAFNLDEMNTHMDAEGQRADSPLSRSSQAAYAAVLEAAGVPKDMISQIPASLISDIAGKRVGLSEALAKIKSDQEIRQGQLDVQREIGLAGAEAKKAEAATEAEKADADRKFKAAEALNKRGLLRRGAEVIPFLRSDETDILRQQAGLDPAAQPTQTVQQFTQDVLDYAAQYGITPAQAQKLKDKRGAQ